MTCLACGHEGYDVLMRGVDLGDAFKREVTVFLPIDKTENTTPIPVSVPERFIREPRCRDEDACAERVRTMS